MQLKLSFNVETLNLPKRFEILERTAHEKGAEITKIIRKVDAANNEIQENLGKIHVGGIGQFQLFLGESGSGKTTFLRTLANFFSNIDITVFDKKSTFDKIIDQITKRGHITGHKLFIIDERDNPIINELELKTFFEELRILFRKKEGQVLVIWPITNIESSEKIAKIAWEVGRDSICPVSGPVYAFKGLDKKLFFEVADDTIRNLNNGESLESFGISKEVADKLLVDSTTIGDYYAKIEQLSYNINEHAWKTLEQKVKPKIWILLPGDSLTELDRTVRYLTQGINNKIDIDRMCSYLDDVNNKSAYLNDWRSKRNQTGFIFRFLDVRLFYMSPNLALSAIRCYGSLNSKSKLNKKIENKKICHDLVKRSNIYLSLTNHTDSSKRSERATKPETQHEYLRLQQLARNQDTELNKALAEAIKSVLIDDGYKSVSIKSEKQELKGTNLKPDIMIELNNNEVVCLELTWRTSGAEIPNELSKQQNTLSPGHIQKYVLDKVMEYVKELEI